MITSYLKLICLPCITSSSSPPSLFFWCSSTWDRPWSRDQLYRISVLSWPLYSLALSWSRTWWSQQDWWISKAHPSALTLTVLFCLFFSLSDWPTSTLTLLFMQVVVSFQLYFSAALVLTWSWSRHGLSWFYPGVDTLGLGNVVVSVKTVLTTSLVVLYTYVVVFHYWVAHFRETH